MVFPASQSPLRTGFGGFWGTRPSRKGFELDPKYVFAYTARGDAYKDNGDLDHAIADYSKAIELDPNHIECYVDRGIAYRLKGDLDRASDDFTDATRIEPKSYGAYNSRCWALPKLNRPQPQCLRQRPWSAQPSGVCWNLRSGSTEASSPPESRARGRRVGARSPGWHP
jgi:tetratricopeptide (TPR) repeat protein